MLIYVILRGQLTAHERRTAPPCMQVSTHSVRDTDLERSFSEDKSFF